jgi:hypothetical protein
VKLNDNPGDVLVPDFRRRVRVVAGGRIGLLIFFLGPVGIVAFPV